ncbi:hypothetical protein ABW19_dt0205474 [Dactylella cylindrospora]|nr:hypothetical protein ABW19_dt0205474 [Dactylella cylindrospora]
MDDSPPPEPGFEAIDPTLRAHIYGLVSALGGPSADNPNIYLLGDDVLGCLRDIKRWLKGYDEKLNRLDVARCLSEANVVAGDLVEILSNSLIKDHIANNNPNKISLACVELLVPLTWPLEKSDFQMTVNHHRHIAILKRSQVSYKQVILTHPSKSILKACCVNALPPMEIPLAERTNRDEGIIRLILYLVRNLLQIDSTEGDSDDTREDISRSTTIDSFAAQGVFNLLIAIISGVPELFEQQDVVILDVLFHLLSGVDVNQIARSQEKSGGAKDPLMQMLRQEEQAKRSNTKASRHNRFGTAVILQKGNGQKAVISGQDALVNEENGLRKLDATKKWRKPQHTGKKSGNFFGAEVHLSKSAGTCLQGFIIRILQSGFNSLFQSVRKAIERDSERVLTTTHPTQLFYTASLILSFGMAINRERQAQTRGESFDFGQVSTLLHAETTIVLFRHLRECLDLKLWRDVQACCLFFVQILLITTEMAQSKNPDERSVADNILSRIFYEETLQDLMVAVLRSGSKRPIRYLDTVTQMTHVYLRSLERYSRQNTSMVVRSKRKNKPDSLQSRDANSSDESSTENARHSSEKHFDFLKCESKFLSEPCLEPFLELLEYHKELDPSQVRRCINFLHRIFVKRGAVIGLFSLRTISLLHELAQNTRGIPGYTEVQVFVQYFGKQLVRKLDTLPALFVEILFHKSPKTSYFLQNGKDRELPPKRLRLPPSLEIKGDLEKDRRIAIAVSLVMLDETCSDQLGWVESILENCRTERKNIEDGSLSSSENVTAMPVITIRFNDSTQTLKHLMSSKLQLLMEVVGFKAEGENEHNFGYVLAGDVSASTLQESLSDFLAAKQSPITDVEIGDSAAALVVKKAKPRVAKKVPSGGSDTDNDTQEDLSSDAYEFPDNLPGGSSNPRNKKSKSSRRRRPLDEAEAEARREQRKLKEKERRKGIKSALYISSSDDDSDVERHEFFENERKLREAMSKATIDNGDTDAQAPSKKRSPISHPTRRRLKRQKVEGPDSPLDNISQEADIMGDTNGSEDSELSDLTDI